LINWDLRHNRSQPAALTPGLFTDWHADPKDIKRWICTVRQGVTFHDGSPFNADAVIWNLRRIFDDKSLQYDAPQAPIVYAVLYVVKGFEKIDDKTVAISTSYPFTFLPSILTRILMASPAQWGKVGKSWPAFAKAPSGIVPFKITRVVYDQYVEMVRNELYWDKTRVPKLDKLA